MGGHHLVLGELNDYLTGEVLEDSHDERYRQKIARLLVESRGYPRESVHPRFRLRVTVGDRVAVIPVDFLVGPINQPHMVVKYAPGSLTTRHRCVAAAALLIGPNRIPIGVVTNGEDAETLDNRTGTILASGLSGIPSRKTLDRLLTGRRPESVTDRQKEMASRILYAFEVDGKCPCDDTVCEL